MDPESELNREKIMYQERRSAKKAVLVVVAIALFSWISGGVIAYSLTEKPQKKVFKNLELFTKVYSIIDQSYVEPVDEKELIYGAIRGMLESLDPHSIFMTPDEYSEMKTETSGEFGGLGIEIAIRDGVLTVISPIDDTPAYKAGVQAGDKIVKIEETFTESLSIFQAVKLMKGPPGTKVTIFIKRATVPDLIKLTITRAVIKVKSVAYQMVDDDNAYMRIKSFQRDTGKELKKAIEELQKKKPLKGMILDLRTNPGGLLQEAVDVANLFYDEGVIVSTVRRDPKLTKYETATKGEAVYRGSLIVMINEGSASASEIVAGALQDNERALIVGQQSFGKGSVQHVIDLDDGAGMKLTIAKFVLPKGRAIQGVGITPDVAIPQKLKDEKTGKIIEPKESELGVLKEKDLPHHLVIKAQKEEKGPPPVVPIKDDTKVLKASADVKIKNREFDYQLNRTVDYLKNWDRLPKLFQRIQIKNNKVALAPAKK